MLEVYCTEIFRLLDNISRCSKLAHAHLSWHQTYLACMPDQQILNCLEVMDSSKQALKGSSRCVVGSMLVVGSMCVTVNNGLLSGWPFVVTWLDNTKLMLAPCLQQHLTNSQLGEDYQSWVHKQVTKHHPSFLLPQLSRDHKVRYVLGCAPAAPLTCVLPRLCLRKGGNKDGKIFTIRDVDTTAISSCGVWRHYSESS